MIEETQLITVIVPVYKVEKYLHRCVESILSQTYKNIEILLIDDDSPDNCPEICDAYARDYSNIKSVHLKNSGIGVSGARNAGLDNATGDYITFIDSDDYVHKDLLKILITSLRSDPSVKMAMASYQKVTEDTKQFEQIEENNVSLLSDLEAFNLLIEDQNKSALWSKLFERTIFDQLRFPVDKHNEDMFLMPFILKKANNIAFAPQPIYYYFQDNESLCRSAFNYNKLDMIEALLVWEKFVSNNYPVLQKKFNSHYFSVLINYCQYLGLKKDDFGKKKFEEYKVLLLKNFKKITNSRFISINNKIKIFLLRLGVFKTYFVLMSFVGSRKYN